MNFGICTLNAIPLKREPDDTSEMVSQILFGETFVITDLEKNWIKIVLDFDQYEGWVSENQVKKLNKDDYNNLKNNNTFVLSDLITFISQSNSDLQTISLGGSLPFYDKNSFHILENKYNFEGSVQQGEGFRKNLVRTAQLFLNTPYLWGGRTPFGIDCSGFTQMVYKVNGYMLYRDAHQQARQGEVLSFIEESEPGDLAFFDNEEGEIIHVGMILDNNYIIHCNGKVRIDRLDHSGIYNVDTKRHTHKLRIMKKVI
jgi:cell wall-associated NlpC family hydrolase